jgi:hypothetical protein
MKRAGNELEPMGVSIAGHGHQNTIFLLLNNARIFAYLFLKSEMLGELRFSWHLILNLWSNGLTSHSLVAGTKILPISGETNIKIDASFP